MLRWITSSSDQTRRRGLHVGQGRCATVTALLRLSLFYVMYLLFLWSPYTCSPALVDPVHDEWQRQGLACGIIVFVEGYDLQLASKHNLLDSGFYHWLLARASRGEISWLAGGAPCGTWSAVLYNRFPKFNRVFVGPRPWHIEIRHRIKKISTISLL